MSVQFVARQAGKRVTQASDATEGPGIGYYGCFAHLSAFVWAVNLARESNRRIDSVAIRELWAVATLPDRYVAISS